MTQAAASCTYALLPTSQSVVAGGGTGSTAVTTLAGCAWTGVSNNTSWLTVTSGASGTGPGTVAFSASANSNTTARTGTLTIGGQTFSVTQNAASCAFTISPASMQQVPFAGANGSSTVTTSDGCAWTATSNTSWITVTSGAQGTTSGQVTFAVAPSTATSQRLGSLTIAGRTFAVTQVGNTCSYVLTPPNQTIGGEGGTDSISVGTASGCAWTATSNQSWISVSGTGTASGSASYTVSANTTGTSRVGSISIGTQSFTVTQAAAGCTFAISANSLSVVAAGGTGSTNVTSGAGCAWTAASNDSWITVTSGASGSGNGPVGFSVAANPNTSARTGTLTIATKTFTVSQAASACSYSLTPTSRAVGSAGANTTTDVTTAPGCAWTAVSNATAWLAITNGTSGSGNGTVSFSASTNTTTQVRVGTATIAGLTFTVTQNAASCAFTVSPTSMQQVPFAGANGSSTVTTSDGCAWTATSNTSWITVTSGAQGTTSGQVTFAVAPSTATSQRLGSLTIAGRTVAVTQVGNTCSYVLTPANRTIGGEGGTGSITVGTASGCPWTATSNQSWISVSGTGTASGSASYTVSANMTGTSRVGSISIGTQSFSDDAGCRHRECAECAGAGQAEWLASRRHRLAVAEEVDLSGIGARANPRTRDRRAASRRRPPTPRACRRALVYGFSHALHVITEALAASLPWMACLRGSSAPPVEYCSNVIAQQ